MSKKIMSEQEAVALAKNALVENGATIIPKVLLAYFSQSRKVPELDDLHIRERWVVEFEIPDSPEWLDGSFAVYVYLDGSTEVPELL